MDQFKIFLFGGAFVVVALAAFLILGLPLLSASKQPAVKIAQIDPKLDMEKKINLAFTSASDRNIITYINLATLEKDQAKKYADYMKAYSKMAAVASKSAAQKEAMSALQTYAKTLPGYKESDFNLPK